MSKQKTCLGSGDAQVEEMGTIYNASRPWLAPKYVKILITSFHTYDLKLFQSTMILNFLGGP